MIRIKERDIAGVIFDMDGVIIDSMPVWDKLPDLYIESLGIRAPGDLGKILFTMTLPQAYGYLKERFSLEQSIEEVGNEIGALMYEQYRSRMPAKAGVISVIQKLQKEKLPMVIATAGDRRMVQAALVRFGLQDAFAAILTPEEFHCSKEEPDMFYGALQVLQTKAENTIVFDDALHAIDTAKKLGILTAGVYDAASEEKQEALREISDLYLSSFEDFCWE